MTYDLIKRPKWQDKFEGLDQLAVAARNNLPLRAEEIEHAEGCLREVLLPPSKRDLDRLQKTLDGMVWPAPEIIPDRVGFRAWQRLILANYPALVAEAGLAKAGIAANAKVHRLDIERHCEEIMDEQLRPVVRYVEQARVAHDKRIEQECAKQERIAYLEDVRRRNAAADERLADALAKRFEVSVEMCRAAVRVADKPPIRMKVNLRTCLERPHKCVPDVIRLLAAFDASIDDFAVWDELGFAAVHLIAGQGIGTVEERIEQVRSFIREREKVTQLSPLKGDSETGKGDTGESAKR